MTVLTEDQVLETLSSQTNLNDFLDAANVILLSGIKQFLPQLFINNDEDIREFAVKPLLAKSGPLDNIDVSLRLIYALGKIKKSVYADTLYRSNIIYLILYLSIIITYKKSNFVIYFFTSISLIYSTLLIKS